MHIRFGMPADSTRVSRVRSEQALDVLKGPKRLIIGSESLQAPDAIAEFQSLSDCNNVITGANFCGDAICIVYMSCP